MTENKIKAKEKRENGEDIDMEHWISLKPSSWNFETSDGIIVCQYEVGQNNTVVVFHNIDDDSLNSENQVDNEIDAENY